MTFEEVSEVKDSISVQAPACGCFTLLIYQLRQFLHFEYLETRWLRRNRWTATVERWLDCHHDESTSVEDDPHCECKRPPAETVPSADDPRPLVIVSADRRFSLLAEAYEVMTTQSRAALFFPELQWAAQDAPRADGAPESPLPAFILPAEKVPPSLRFLAGLDDRPVEVVVADLPAAAPFTHGPLASHALLSIDRAADWGTPGSRPPTWAGVAGFVRPGQGEKPLVTESG
jgi:hypothetical protein